MTTGDRSLLGGDRSINHNTDRVIKPDLSSLGSKPVEPLSYYERERLIWQSTLSGNEKLLALALNSFVDGHGECFPGQETLASMCGLKDRTIRNLCKSLEEKGVIERVHRYRKGGNRTSDKYRLSFTVLAEEYSGTGNPPSLPENSSGRDEAEDSNAVLHDLNLPEKYSCNLPEIDSGSESLPENDDTLTGKSQHPYRKMTTPLPEKFSGDLSRGSIQGICPEEEDPPLAPQGGDLSLLGQKVIPIEQAEQPEDCLPIPDSPKPHHDNPVGELKGSGEGKSSEARSRNRNRRSKAGRAERIYRQLEGDPRYEAGKFYQWFDWYKRKLCEPYGKAHGDKAGAAASWMNLVESGVNLQQVSAGSSQYLGWVRCNPDRRSCEIPHAHNFLEGKSAHPTPYWQLALEDATPTPVAGAEFVAEPAPTMTRQEWSKRLGALLRETGYLLPDASGDCPSTHYVTSAIELSADELSALVAWLESLSARRSA
jgi:hypothetical protein